MVPSSAALGQVVRNFCPVAAAGDVGSNRDVPHVSLEVSAHTVEVSSQANGAAWYAVDKLLRSAFAPLYAPPSSICALVTNGPTSDNRNRLPGSLTC